MRAMSVLSVRRFTRALLGLPFLSPKIFLIRFSQKMDHRKAFLLNLSRALTVLESQNLAEAGTLEKVRTDKTFRGYLRKPKCGLRKKLLDAFLGKNFSSSSSDKNCRS